MFVRLQLQRFIPIIIIVLGIGMIISMARSIYTIWSRRDIVVQQEEKLKQLEQEQIELKNTLSKALTPYFVEQEARDKLGFVKEGETVVFLPQASESAAQKTKDSQPSSASYMNDWLRLFF